MLRHGRSVLCTCRMVLGNLGEADDAFQATFLVLARRAGSLRMADSVGPWLQGVARRIALKARKAAIRRRVHERRSAVSVLIDPPPRCELSESVREAVERLPKHLRDPIVLCYFEQMSYKAAAEQLGLTEGAIRGRIAKARELLKLRLAQGPGANKPTLRHESSLSLEHSVPLMLVDATTRACVSCCAGGANESRIAAKILGLAEGALRMMFVSRIIRAVAVVLIGVFGAALIQRQANGTRIAAEPVSGRQQIAALKSTKTDPRLATQKTQPDPKRETARDILIQGASIRSMPENDQFTGDGPGTMSLWVDRGLLTETIAPVAQAKKEPLPNPGQANDIAKPLADGPRGEPVLLKFSWTGRMNLIGRSTGALGRQVGRVEFYGQVTAQTVDALIHCEDQMIVLMAGPISHETVEVAPMGPTKDNLTRHPQAKLVTIRANREAVVLSRIVDPDRHLVLKQQRLEADGILIYDRRAGSYQIPAKGRLRLFEPAAKPSPPTKVPAPTLIRIDIAFTNGMLARVGTGKGADTIARSAEFSGGVTVSWVGVTDVKPNVKPDLAADQGGYMQADSLRIVSKTSLAEGQPSHPESLYMQASGNVDIISSDHSIRAIRSSSICRAT